MALNGYDKFRMANPNHPVAMLKRPGIVAVVAGDRTTYSQFAACVAAVQATPGSSMFWELAGGGGVAAARNLHVERALKQFKGREFWLWFVDDDHQFEKDILGTLLARDRDLIVPMVLGRFPPHNTIGTIRSRSRASSVPRMSFSN